MGHVILHFFIEQGMETWKNGILTPQQTPVENKLFGNYQSKFTLKVYFTMFKD